MNSNTPNVGHRKAAMSVDASDGFDIGISEFEQANQDIRLTTQMSQDEYKQVAEMNGTVKSEQMNSIHQHELNNQKTNFNNAFANAGQTSTAKPNVHFSTIGMQSSQSTQINPFPPTDQRHGRDSGRNESPFAFHNKNQQGNLEQTSADQHTEDPIISTRPSEYHTVYRQHSNSSVSENGMISDSASIDSTFESIMTVNDALKVALLNCKTYIDKYFPSLETESQSTVTGYVYDERCLKHKHMHMAHPECPERILCMSKALISTGLAARMQHVAVRPATNEEVRTVHSEEHLKQVYALKDEQIRLDRQGELQHNSAYANEHTVESAFLSAGGVLELAMKIAHGELRNGITILRPPGHHAECSKIMGFCVFNNIAIAASWLVNSAPRCQPGRKNRVLIVDWDVHHGNGTQHMFETDPDVMYFSVHRWDYGHFFPNGPDGGPDCVGVDKGKGTNINVGWNGDGPFGDPEYMAVWTNVLMPAARTFAPDFILVSAGFDAAAGDPLGGCSVSPFGYGHLLHSLLSLASGRIIVSLEGGYNLRALSECALTCTAVLLGTPPPPMERSRPPSNAAMHSIQSTIAAHHQIHNPAEESFQLPSWTCSVFLNRSENIFKRPVFNRGLSGMSDYSQTNDKPIFTSPSPLPILPHSNTPIFPNANEFKPNMHQNLAVPNDFAKPDLSKSMNNSQSNGGEDFRTISARVSHEFSASNHGQTELHISATKPGELFETVKQDFGDGGCFKVVPLKFSPNVEHHVNIKDFNMNSFNIHSNVCEACGQHEERWVCLKCFKVFCGRNVNGHMVEHSNSENHLIAMSFEDLSVWDYSLDAYLDTYVIPALKVIYSVAHEQKFGTAPEFPANTQ